MKKYTASFMAAIVLATAMNVSAGENNGANPFFASLSAATAAEMPATAAELVSKATPKQQRQTTIGVVKAAVPLNPAAAPAIVGSIAQAVPEMAAIAAATAVSLVPNQVAAIARAAAAAAPTKAGKIVEAICLVLPKDYKNIANAVAEVAPGQGKEILTGISASIPALKVSLNKILASYSGNNLPTVGTVLGQISSLELASAAQTSESSPALAPPTVGPPYIPLGVPHQNIDPGSGGEVPGGGRDYSAP